MNERRESVENENCPASVKPVHISTFALPEDEAVKLAFTVYNPAKESQQLQSEEGRTIFAETFIENRNLGTLADLCARAVAKEYGLAKFPGLAYNPLLHHLQLNSISVDTPLEDVYQIEDVKFWRRVALAKTKDQSLKCIKDSNFNWKSEAITLKYIELVEECPAGYWPEEKMYNLAMKIKDHVVSIRIRKLQSLDDWAFRQYLRNDSDTDKSTSSDVSSTTDEEPEPIETPSIGEEEEHAEIVESPAANIPETKVLMNIVATDHSSPSMSSVQTVLPESAGKPTAEALAEERKEAIRLSEKFQKRIDERRAARRARRALQQKRRERREEKLAQQKELLQNPKPKRRKVKGVFDIPVEESEDTDAKKMDSRNLARYLTKKKTYNYPPQHCHHVDLRFVRYFDNLVSFVIEFHPPELKTNYHTRHFNFSYDDVENLASGLSGLKQLRVFRLRNSRMDSQKFSILARVLSQLNVETIDFGNNQLEDCEFVELFQDCNTIKHLELEGNRFGSTDLRQLGRALKLYAGKLIYLGLAQNPIDSEALHALCSKIVCTPQIEYLCLAGINLSEMSILCCVSDELLTRHTVLRGLDLMAVPLSSISALLIIRALRSNYNVLDFSWCGENLDIEWDMDMELCLQRNRYMAENPYVGNTTQTAEQIEEFLSRTKNPILLQAKEEVNKRLDCLAARPDIAKRFSTIFSTSAYSHVSEEGSSNSINEKKSSDADEKSVTTTDVDDTSSQPSQFEPFLYDAANFDLEQFYEHIKVPGPGQRYYYLQAHRKVDCTNID